jgi:isoleucyl-tRNA synthetase
MTEPAAPNYKDTLNLPKTAFDMKANLTQREPAMLKAWQEANLYQQIRNAPHPKGKWVLHDGPPYANGDIHIGHLINKVLKDIVVKFRTMQGHDSPYVPGWDCHGLPIESAIQKELGPKFRELSKDEVRQKCRDYAMKYVKLQSDSFQRLGILGEFQNPYLTLNPAYESGILEVLAELVKRDLVYRQKKPVHWCTNDRTALAEAELEYANRKDNSIYVLFQKQFEHGDPRTPSAWQDFAQKFADVGGEGVNMYDMGVNFVIWTTTPWTLPANRAVAVHPEMKYVLVHYHEGIHQIGGESLPRPRYLVVAEALVERLMAHTKSGGKFEISAPISGEELAASGWEYLHPLDNAVAKKIGTNRLCPIVTADYVTTSDGTGLVHTAPGHGKEDYQTGLKYNLEVYNPVLPDGRYDDSVPDFLQGKTIWDANDLVIEKLKETNALFHAQQFDHEYPHCWRCKKPVIFRATEQWFVRASAEPAQTPGGNPGLSRSTTTGASPLWDTAKKFINQVQWIPAWGKNRIDGMLDTRPDWCISRQRSWGVPIPAFFDDNGNLLLTEKSVRTIAAHFAKHGADSWYTHTPQQLLGAEEWHDTWITPSGKIENRKLKIENGWHKGQDILDVWFESGASHHAVLERTHPELGYPADMYLEGSDQHRGWFQSSLLEAAGCKNEPPFKSVLTHGFAVDEQGKKYSKSSGNYVPLEQLLKQHGADVLRLWVASVDYQNDIRFGPNLLATISEAYRKIRNTIRYLLGNLYDFDPTENSVDPAPHSIDQWMKAKVDAWAADVHAAYDRYEFHTVFKRIYEFCNVEISAIYAKAIKDRLYCELPDSDKRRASQTVCYRTLMRLIELCAPILAFTADEAWAAVRKLPGCAELDPSVHLVTFSFLDDPNDLVDDLTAGLSDEDAGENAALDIINTLTQGLQETVDATLAAKHWQVLMPLIEKGNKQLDDLKRTVGLGNPLDAEAVILVPHGDDDLARHIADYAPEIEDALGVGFHRLEYREDGAPWDIQILDTRTRYPSCARSWKRRPDVGSNPQYPDLSARDAAVVTALRNPQ